MGGETIKGENRGKTTWGEISWGRNDFLPIVQPAHLAGAISKMSVSCCSNKKKKKKRKKKTFFFTKMQQQNYQIYLLSNLFFTDIQIPIVYLKFCNFVLQEST